MNVLIVDDQKPVREFFTDVLQENGFGTLTAKDGREAIELYRIHRPAFTLTDISMPGMNGLDLLRQIKECNPEAVVMLMTGAGNEAFAVEALRGGAVNYFNKPVDVNELINTLNRYASLAAGYDYELYTREFLREERLNLVLNNDLHRLNHAVQMIVNHCRAVFPTGELYTLRFGLYEMLVNAIEHGNLGITYEEKSQALEDNALGALMEERVKDAARAGRRVGVVCEISPRGFQCTIEDQGDGFDHSLYSSAPDPAALFEKMGGSLHGRGIILTLLQFDRVAFSAKGNQVTICKWTNRNGGNVG